MIAWIKNKIASYQFRKVKKTLVYGRDFEYYTIGEEDYDPSRFSLKVLTGEFKDVVLMYSNLKVVEVDNTAELVFDTDVVVNPNSADLKSRKAKRLFTDIMRVLLINSTTVDKNELRKNDSAELDEERSLREEDVAVRQGRVSKRKPRKKAVQGD